MHMPLCLLNHHTRVHGINGHINYRVLGYVEKSRLNGIFGYW